MRERPNGGNPVETLKLGSIEVGGISMSFHRTCRVPEGQVNSLPASMGHFPVYKVSDFKSGTPEGWRDDGFFLPMYTQEAMWIGFDRGYKANPKALIVGAGNINAVSGKPFDTSKAILIGDNAREAREGDGSLEIRLEEKQNYLVVPPQPWIDGWKSPEGKVYQFVAAELGSGETVEGQITGEETAGGIQLIVYDPKEGQVLIPATTPHEYISGGYAQFFGGAMKGGGSPSMMSMSATRGLNDIISMGLGRGGEIRQKIYDDPHGFQVWKEKPTAVDMVYLVSSEDFKQVTGYDAPPTPVSFADYQKQGKPWFDLHDNNLKDAPGSDVFAKLKPVGAGVKPAGPAENYTAPETK